MVRGALPYWPVPGLANALALNQRASGWSADAARSASLPEVFGSPTRLGRCRPPKRPRFVSDEPALITAFKGPPLTSSTIADAFQPPARVYPRLFSFDGLGRFTIGARIIRC